MALNQLLQVVAWERDKEDQLARQFQMAQQHAQQHQHKLNSLEQYRLDYLRQTQQRGSGGVGGRHFTQYHAFIAKLDKACEQQTQVHAQAVMVADQRKTQWLHQQRKRKAVEMLIDKQQKQAQKRHERQEQNLLDEFAMQKYLRQQAK